MVVLKSTALALTMHDVGKERRGVRREEWIGLALFAGVDLLALPFVHDAFIVQRVWLTLCSAAGLTQ
jgi:hypothetical protein